MMTMMMRTWPGISYSDTLEANWGKRAIQLHFRHGKDWAKIVGKLSFILYLEQIIGHVRRDEVRQRLLADGHDGLLGGEELEALVLLLVAQQHEQDGDVCDVLPADSKCTVQ